MRQLYFEDLKVGDVFPSASRTLNDSHYTLFSAITGDAHPIHYDAEYARERGWQGPVAHGLLLLGMCALGAAPISHALRDSMIAMLGSEARYRKPAFAGDTVRPEFRVESLEPKGAERGVVRLSLKLTNQRGETLVEGAHVIMLRRRLDPAREQVN